MLPRLHSVWKPIKAHSVVATWLAASIPLAGAIIALMFKGSTYRLEPFKESLYGKEGVFMQGHIYQLDIKSKTITISWVIGGCGSYGVESHSQVLVGDTCRMVNRPIDVYVDGGPAQNGTVWSYDPDLHPRDPRTGGMIYVQALNEFQTTQLLNIAGTRYLGQDWTQEHEYPFDWYLWATSLVLVNPLNVSEEIPIIHIAATDLSNNFVPTSQHESPINKTLVTLDGSRRSLSGRFLYVRFDRNTTTKTFVMIIFFVNWALTFVVFHITVLSLVSKDVTMSDGVLVLPVTVILTIPALRSLYVEDPAFGIYIDNVGLFLQMIIASVCSIVLLVNSTRYRLADKRPGPQDSTSVTNPPATGTANASGAVQIQTTLTRQSLKANAQVLDGAKQSQNQP